MGLGSIVEKFAEEVVGYSFVPKMDRESALSEFVSFISRARKDLKIVAGELYPRIYNSPEILHHFEKMLGSGGELCILAHLDSDNEEAARKHFKDNNNLLPYLKSKYGDKVCISWTPERIRVHYGIADDRDIFIEEEHEPKKGRDVWYLRREKAIASKWSKKFDELAQKENIVRIL